MSKKQGKKKSKRRYNPNKHKPQTAQAKRPVTLAKQLAEINRLRPVYEAGIADRQRMREKERNREHDIPTNIST